MVWGLIGFAVAGAIGCNVGGSRPAPRLTEQQEYGRSLYNGYCAACHEVNQLDLKKMPPELHGMFAQGHLPSGGPATDEAVHNVITRGRNTMPSFDGRLTGEQVDAIVAYLRGGIK
jgi:mono/diheme cytochrome c family protein